MGLARSTYYDEPGGQLIEEARVVGAARYKLVRSMVDALSRYMLNVGLVPLGRFLFIICEGGARGLR